MYYKLVLKTGHLGAGKGLEKVKYCEGRDILSVFEKAHSFPQVKKKERRLKIHAIRSELDVYPFNEQAAVRYGPIRAALEKQGKPISERDTQIASIAVANKLCVVTHNTREFSRIPGLRIEDWTSG